MSSEAWILSRLETNNIFALIQQYLMLFDTRMTGCKLECTLVDHLTISIKESQTTQHSITIVVENYLSDYASNTLACKLPENLRFTRLKL